MPITVTCTCGKQYQVANEHAGKSFTCKACKATGMVPADEAPSRNQKATPLKSTAPPPAIPPLPQAQHAGAAKGATPPATDDTRQCPSCAETIKTASQKCRFCGEDLLTDFASRLTGTGATKPFKAHPLAMYLIAGLTALALIGVTLTTLAPSHRKPDSTPVPATGDLTPAAPSNATPTAEVDPIAAFRTMCDLHFSSFRRDFQVTKELEIGKKDPTAKNDKYSTYQDWSNEQLNLSRHGFGKSEIEMMTKLSPHAIAETAWTIDDAYSMDVTKTNSVLSPLVGEMIITTHYRYVSFSQISPTWWNFENAFSGKVFKEVLIYRSSFTDSQWSDFQLVK